MEKRVFGLSTYIPVRDACVTLIPSKAWPICPRSWWEQNVNNWLKSKKSKTKSNRKQALHTYTPLNVQWTPSRHRQQSLHLFLLGTVNRLHLSLLGTPSTDFAPVLVWGVRCFFLQFTMCIVLFRILMFFCFFFWGHYSPTPEFFFCFSLCPVPWPWTTFLAMTSCETNNNNYDNNKKPHLPAA